MTEKQFLAAYSAMQVAEQITQTSQVIIKTTLSFCLYRHRVLATWVQHSSAKKPAGPGKSIGGERRSALGSI